MTLLFNQVFPIQPVGDTCTSDLCSVALHLSFFAVNITNVLAKHAKGFQQVLMGRESQDALSLFTLASEVEPTQKLLWLRTVFHPDIIDDDHQVFT